MRITIYEKGVYHALCSLTLRKPRKLFKILSRSMAMIDAHGYDYSHILIVDYRLWDFISEILSYNEVYCIFISAWGLELLVLTRWAIPRASKSGASNGYSSTSFFVMENTLTTYSKLPNLESIGFFIYNTLWKQNTNKQFCQIFDMPLFLSYILLTNKYNF